MDFARNYTGSALDEITEFGNAAPAMPRLRKIREARRLSQAKLANLVGTSQPQIDRLEKGQRRLTEEWILRLSSALNCDPAELIEYPRSGRKQARHPLEEEGFALIPTFDAGASAAPGKFFDRDKALYRLAFHHQWLRRVTSAPPEQLAIIEADIDSMEPTIRSGDHMLIDKTQTNPRRNGIYVVWWDGWVNVKRVTTDPARRLVIVSSDNPAYPPTEAVKPDDLVVLGRVIWIGRRV